MNPKKHCPRCNKRSEEPGAEALESIPVYCVRTCLEEVALGGDVYWRPKA